MSKPSFQPLPACGGLTVTLGCNLQHYHTPVIEKKAREIWDYPEDWQMKAQLVFGGRKSKDQPPAK